VENSFGFSVIYQLSQKVYSMIYPPARAQKFPRTTTYLILYDYIFNTFSCG